MGDEQCSATALARRSIGAPTRSCAAAAPGAGISASVPRFGGSGAILPPQVPMQPQAPSPPGTPPQQRPQAQAPQGSIASPQEEILFQGQARHMAFAADYIKWALVSIAAGVAATFLAKIQFFQSMPLWLLSFIGVPGMLWTFLRHLTTRYKVTLRRVEMERGIVAKEVDSLELWRVLDVKFSQSLLDRILGNAKVILTSTDQSHPELLLYGLPDARRLFERIREAVAVARHGNRPMEIAGHEQIEHFEHGPPA
jgi:membrane protein YdbS with pleckstrin-like domain